MEKSKHQAIAEELIEVMRLLSYPVTIVTSAADKSKRGVTIGSFTSLSMDPPLISFNVIKSSQMHNLLEKAERFVVHVPGIGQKDLCTHFATPDLSESEQFRELVYLEEEGVPPVLDNMIAEIYCSLYHRFEAGDHSIIIGSVEKVKKNRDEPAVLYLNGEYTDAGQG